MGRLLSKLPTDVHLGKFLLTAALFRCLDPALTIAAALNSKSPFVSPFGMEQEADRAKNSFRAGEQSIPISVHHSLPDIVADNSDFLTIHNAFSSWRRASANPGFIRKFCRANFLSHQVHLHLFQYCVRLISISFTQNLQQIEELRQQFLGCGLRVYFY
jgi:ATP-dependent RNA helicase DHX29